MAAHEYLTNVWMNEFYNLYPACETQGYSPAVDGA